MQEFYKTQPTLSKPKKNKNIQNMTTDSFLNKNTKYSLSPASTNYLEFSSNKTNANNRNNDKDILFITDSSSFSSSTRNRKTFNNINILDNNFENTNYRIEGDSKANTFYDILNQTKINYKKNSQDFSNNFDYQKLYSSFNKVKNSGQNKFYNYIQNINMKDNIIIKFYYFELVLDEEFNLFKQKHQDNWKKINNILANFNILFEKLNIYRAFIDSNKILKLIEFYKGKTKNVTNKDLLMCLTNSDLKEKGYDPNNEYILYGRIKEAFIVRIQKNYRKRLAIKKYKEMKYLFNSLIKLQKNIKGFLIRKAIIPEIENSKLLIHNQYNELFKQFQKDYDEIQIGPRVEIHINSLSYNGNFNNCLTEKYPMKENLQISRLIRLIDPNVDIIYIIPYEFPEEIISYYYSILENIGITNLDKRVQFIVPSSAEFLPLNYSLSKLLLFSNKTIAEIKRLVKNKKCYIMPGQVGDVEEKLSLALNIPMLMSPKNQIDLIFNKSGIKSSFEINDIPFPISAWNIITEEEFYSSLAHLIASYPNIKIWIFKSNLDINATGIAYLDTNKIDIINQLRKEKKNDKTFTIEKFQEKLFIHLKSILIKNVSFAFPKLYKNWKQYLKHFLSDKGVIECCPTKDLNGIMGRPCIPILIEPNGKIKILPSYEKITVDYFKTVISTSPQKCLDNSEMIKLGDKMGNFLFSQGIVGYVTLDCITFHNTKKILHWCVDMKYGYTQTICDIQFSYFLFIQSILQKDILKNKFINININNVNEEIKENNFNIDYNGDSFINNKKENEYNPINYIKNKNNDDNLNNDLNENINSDQLLSDSMVFSIPYISEDLLKELKLKDLLREFRYNNLVYNSEKREGIIFNLCDGLECGILGLCGIINLEDIEKLTPELKLWKLINSSIDLLKSMIFKLKKEIIISSISKFNEIERNDKIDLLNIINRIKKIIKEKELEQEKEENRRKKLANSPFI